MSGWTLTTAYFPPSGRLLRSVRLPPVRGSLCLFADGLTLHSPEKSIGGECWSFGVQNDSGAVDQNTQVARLTVALGENDVGKMAILKAVAECHGVVDEKKLKRLASGESSPEERLRVPSHLRGALCEIGLHGAIAPINVMETVETQRSAWPTRSGTISSLRLLWIREP